MLSKPFNVILAISKNFGIGNKGQLPWSLRHDLQNLKNITTNINLFNKLAKNKQNAVIMGRKTYESLPAKVRPMPNRLNIVLSHEMTDASSYSGALVCKSLPHALETVEQRLQDKVEEVFVLGGARVFEEALAHERCQQVFLTKVGLEFPCDTFVSKDILKDFKHLETSKTYVENDIPFTFSRYYKPKARGLNPEILTTKIYEQHEEFQYLELIDQVIRTGHERSDRTQTGIISKFGGIMRFNLENGFPLLTTKDVFWRGVVEELLWFIRGETNSKTLAEKKIKIWDGNGSRQFLDSMGFVEREEGDLGPVYGFQWRNFGAEYKGINYDYSKQRQGVDQLKYIIETIKKDPYSRRLVMSAWNPKDIPLMALPPCHVLSQFYVDDGKLSCMMYQRSADMGLGVPFNIASYSLLTCLIAEVWNIILLLLLKYFL